MTARRSSSTCLVGETRQGFVFGIAFLRNKMSETASEFERLLGQAALRLWPDLPRADLDHRQHLIKEKPRERGHHFA
jgi:hypothetical protein